MSKFPGNRESFISVSAEPIMSMILHRRWKIAVGLGNISVRDILYLFDSSVFKDEIMFCSTASICSDGNQPIQFSDNYINFNSINDNPYKLENVENDEEFIVSGLVSDTIRCMERLEYRSSFFPWIITSNSRRYELLQFNHDFFIVGISKDLYMPLFNKSITAQRSKEYCEYAKQYGKGASLKVMKFMMEHPVLFSME